MKSFPENERYNADTVVGSSESPDTAKNSTREVTIQLSENDIQFVATQNNHYVDESAKTLPDDFAVGVIDGDPSREQALIFRDMNAMYSRFAATFQNMLGNPPYNEESIIFSNLNNGLMGNFYQILSLAYTNIEMELSQAHSNVKESGKSYAKSLSSRDSLEVRSQSFKSLNQNSSDILKLQKDRSDFVAFRSQEAFEFLYPGFFKELFPVEIYKEGVRRKISLLQTQNLELKNQYEWIAGAWRGDKSYSNQRLANLNSNIDYDSDFNSEILDNLLFEVLDDTGAKEFMNQHRTTLLFDGMPKEVFEKLNEFFYKLTNGDKEKYNEFLRKFLDRVLDYFIRLFDQNVAYLNKYSNRSKEENIEVIYSSMVLLRVGIINNIILSVLDAYKDEIEVVRLSEENLLLLTMIEKDIEKFDPQNGLKTKFTYDKELSKLCFESIKDNNQISVVSINIHDEHIPDKALRKISRIFTNYFSCDVEVYRFNSNEIRIICLDQSNSATAGYTFSISETASNEISNSVLDYPVRVSVSSSSLNFENFNIFINEFGDNKELIAKVLMPFAHNWEINCGYNILDKFQFFQSAFKGNGVKTSDKQSKESAVRFITNSSEIFNAFLINLQEKHVLRTLTQDESIVFDLFKHKYGLAVTGKYRAVVSTPLNKHQEVEHSVLERDTAVFGKPVKKDEVAEFLNNIGVKVLNSGVLPKYMKKDFSSKKPNLRLNEDITADTAVGGKVYESLSMRFGI